MKQHREQVKRDRDIASQLKLAQLKKIKLVRQDGDKEVTVNAADELQAIDDHLDALETIWNKCK